MAEWSMVLVKGTSLFGGMGWSPTPLILSTKLYKVLFPWYWTSANGISYHHPCYWHQNIQARLPSGMKRWFKAPVTSAEWVWVPLLSFCWHSYTKYCPLYLEHMHIYFLPSSPLLTFLYKVLFPLFWTPAHCIFYDHQCHRPQNIQAGWPSGLRRWYKAPVISVAWVQVPLLLFCLHSY